MPELPDLIDDAPARALAVYAHPDDPEISCGGTVARWTSAGTEVHLLLLTRGDKGFSDPDTDPEALAEQRAGEVAEAAAVLGLAGHEQVGVADGELANTAEVRARIVGTVRRVKPDVVICPDPTAVFFGETYFNHHDHRVAGWATLDAVSPAAGSPHYFPEAGPPHQVGGMLLSGTLEPNVWVDVGDTLDAKIQALLCHRSQLQAAAFGHEGGTAEWLASLLRQRAEDGGRLAGVRYAEGFRRLLLAG
ncbi:MAG: PIG-L family deacetylase [Actinobacteria bacterium]|nr:PIG-L family deacetylase [Actinomycetota bacterium]